MGHGEAGEGSPPVSPPGPTVMGILSIRNMQNLLSNASLELEPEKKEQLKKIHRSPVHGAQLQLLTAVNVVFLSNTNTEKLDSPVTFAFSHVVKPQVGRNQLYSSPLSQGQSGSYIAFIFPLCSFLRWTSGPLYLLCPLGHTFLPHGSVLYLVCLRSNGTSSFRSSLTFLPKITIYSYAPPPPCCFFLVLIALTTF